MTKLVLRYSRYYVKTKGRTGARVGSGVLLAGWVLLVLLPVLFGEPVSLAWIAVWSLVLFVPAALLSSTAGKTRLTKVRAILEGRNVPGGFYLVVMDERNERHEMVVDAARAQDLMRQIVPPEPLPAPAIRDGNAPTP